MDLKELRNLVKEYHNCELLKQNTSIAGFVASFRQQGILKELQNNAHHFLTTANIFEKNLKEMFEQKEKVRHDFLSFKVQIKNFKMDNETKSFIYQIKPSIVIKTKHEIKKRILPWFVTVSKNELEDKDFRNNNFEISLLPFLLQTNPQNNKTLQLTCWNIVANNLLYNLSIN